MGCEDRGIRNQSIMQIMTQFHESVNYLSLLNRSKMKN